MQDNYKTGYIFSTYNFDKTVLTPLTEDVATVSFVFNMQGQMGTFGDITLQFKGGKTYTQKVADEIFEEASKWKKDSKVYKPNPNPNELEPERRIVITPKLLSPQTYEIKVYDGTEKYYESRRILIHDLALEGFKLATKILGEVAPTLAFVDKFSVKKRLEEAIEEAASPNKVAGGSKPFEVPTSSNKIPGCSEEKVNAQSKEPFKKVVGYTLKVVGPTDQISNTYIRGVNLTTQILIEQELQLKIVHTENVFKPQITSGNFLTIKEEGDKKYSMLAEGDINADDLS
eukprot:Platyproteum_vivax@DN12207_c0_g1_i1.p1